MIVDSLIETNIDFILKLKNELIITHQYSRNQYDSIFVNNIHAKSYNILYVDIKHEPINNIQNLMYLITPVKINTY